MIRYISPVAPVKFHASLEFRLGFMSSAISSGGNLHGCPSYIGMTSLNMVFKIKATESSRNVTDALKSDLFFKNKSLLFQFSNVLLYNFKCHLNPSFLVKKLCSFYSSNNPTVIFPEIAYSKSLKLIDHIRSFSIIIFIVTWGPHESSCRVLHSFGVSMLNHTD